MRLQQGGAFWEAQRLAVVVFELLDALLVHLGLSGLKGHELFDKLPLLVDLGDVVLVLELELADLLGHVLVVRSKLLLQLLLEHFQFVRNKLRLFVRILLRRRILVAQGRSWRLLLLLRKQVLQSLKQNLGSQTLACLLVRKFEKIRKLVALETRLIFEVGA